MKVQEGTKTVNSLVNMTVESSRLASAMHIHDSVANNINSAKELLKRKTEFRPDILESYKKAKLQQSPNPNQPNSTFISHTGSRPADLVVKPEKAGGNWQCWSRKEEVFLVGAVLERFFARGSLSSTKKETENGGKRNCWDTIKETYDNCFKKYSSRSGSESPPSRTENALSRHYKVMKERCIGKNTKNLVDFRALYDDWELNYNKRFNLIEEPDYHVPETKKKASNVSDFHISGPSQSRGRWNFQDEVVLIGVVVETFFQRGSLSSSHKERKKNEKDFWQNLHNMYEAVGQRYNQVHGLGFGKASRTHQALARHFKVMKVKLIESQGKLNLKTFYREWERKYRHIYLTLSNEPMAMKKERLVIPKMTTSLPQSITLNNTQEQSSISQGLRNFHKNMSAMEARKSAEESQFLPQKATLRNVPSKPNPIVLAGMQAPGQQMKINIDEPTPSNFTLPRTASFSSLFSGNVQNPVSPGILNLQAISHLGGTSSADLFRNIGTPGTDIVDINKISEFLPLISPGNTPVTAEPRVPTPVFTQQGNATTLWFPYTVYNGQQSIPGLAGQQTPTQQLPDNIGNMPKQDNLLL